MHYVECSDLLLLMYHTEADLGMFSMFGHTGAPTQRGPTWGPVF